MQETPVQFLGWEDPPEKAIGYLLQCSCASLVAQLVRNPPAMWVDLGLIPGLGRSPGEGKGYPLQYSGLENSMDCIVHGGPKESDTTERLTISLFYYKSNLRKNDKIEIKNQILYEKRFF